MGQIAEGGSEMSDDAHIAHDLDKVTNALNVLIGFIPKYNCRDLHHEKKDKHAYDKPCPAVARYTQRIDAAMKLLAKELHLKMNAEKMYITKQEELEAIELLLAKYDPEFNGSKDWSQSDTLGKVDWLIGMYISTKQEADMVWGWLPKMNELNALLYAAKAIVARWDTPLWKDALPTATFMHALRDAISKFEDSKS